MIFGGSGSLSGSLAGLFIVEARPKAEWDIRISWFRLAYGFGQVIGLGIPAVLATQLKIGWLLTAVLLLIGTYLATIKLPRLKAVPAPPKSAGQKARKGGLYALFLLVWLIAMTGVQTFFNVVPLIMRDAFAINATVSSLLFLVGGALGTLCYPLAGELAEKWGPAPLFLTGLGTMGVAFAAMYIAFLLRVPGANVIGSVALVIAAIAYAIIVSTTTMLIVTLTSGSEGSAMGLLNGIIAGGAALGANVPSIVASLVGYPPLAGMGAAILVVAIVLGLPLRKRPAAA